MDFSASSHARKFLSGIHVANFNGIPAKTGGNDSSFSRIKCPVVHKKLQYSHRRIYFRRNPQILFPVFILFFEGILGKFASLFARQER